MYSETLLTTHMLMQMVIEKESEALGLEKLIDLVLREVNLLVVLMMAIIIVVILVKSMLSLPGLNNILPRIVMRLMRPIMDGIIIEGTMIDETIVVDGSRQLPRPCVGMDEACIKPMLTRLR
jgi:hypothetical protein